VAPLLFREIRNFVKHYESTGYPLHVLLNNAALQAPKGQRGAKTVDGFEVRLGLPHMCRHRGHLNIPRLYSQITLGVNYFGPLYLTELLLPIMKRSPAPRVITKRIVWVTSLGSQLANPPIIGEGSGWPGISVVPWDDLKCVSGPSHLPCRQYFL
jgi:NAD(P)-dependent dehydrogenase (short-subunit alcohol dehydrogenase family)